MPIHFIGTSHIAQESIDQITHYIQTKKPKIVALELDTHRAKALKDETGPRKIPLSSSLQIGFKGYLFAKLGQYAQQKLGGSVGIQPGSEMKTAMELAAKHNIQAEYIDQPIAITLQRFSKNLTLQERLRFIKDIFAALLFPKRQAKKLGIHDINLQKVPPQELIDKMIENLRSSYPSVYKTLIEDRNRYMIKKLIHLQKENPEDEILAIVGAGHLPGMRELLLKIEVI